LQLCNCGGGQLEHHLTHGKFAPRNKSRVA
jgi:hypothetical protein